MSPTLTTFPINGPITLVARLGHGSVLVAARDGLAEATAQLTPREPGSDILEHFAVELKGTALAVVAPRPGGITELFGARRKDRQAVDVVITVPTGTPLKLATAAADITVTGRCGKADVVTGNAAIDLDVVDGDLRLRAGKGEARIGGVSGHLDCEFGSGTLLAALVRGNLRARAGSGSARVEAAYGDVDLATGYGSLTVGLPDGVSAQLDVRTGSGRLHSELPVEQAPRPGGRTVALRAHTGSGDVHLVRAPAA